ncbi:glyceraldehyde-3-phosphate dehydrogenase [Leptinotarsa decemlineata]|uniref:glyceraldehyde-3-phosphate dehydrogenase n=1 Tax=Leptinotarsa decemlineata TaxID=7539 RepID=UPI000C251FE4|nr:glyceraldehyde-3-phosphate dehydrogenase-like [Leptinotarsa decemlineata]
MVRIGLNGFGRLGKQLLRIAINACKKKCASDVSRILMINDPHLTTESMAYLLKNDSLYGKFKSEVVEMGSSIMVDGQRVEVTSENKIEQIPWKKCNVEYVIDTTGQNANCNKASMFLTEGIKRVIVSGCSNVPIFIVGVNHACFELNMKTVSASTPSLNCVMPLLKVLHENFEIQEAIVTTLEPLNNHDKILDEGYGAISSRSSRSCLNSFFPIVSTSSQKFVDRIMPELEKKTESTAIKIPVPCVGAVEVTAKLGKEAPYELVKHRFNDASQGYLRGMIRYTEEELVSTDIIGDPHSCIFDAKAGIGLTKCLVKIFAWYDCETGFANRVYDLANYIGSRENCSN